VGCGRWVSELYVVRGTWYVVRGRNQTRRARWHVGSSTSYRPHATNRFSKPPPQPSPKGRERCFAATKPWINGAAWAPDQVRDMPRLAGAQHPWPGICLHLFSDLIPIPRTRPDTPAEIRGPCHKRSRSSAVADAQTLERRGRFETFPYRLRAEY